VVGRHIPVDAPKFSCQLGLFPGFRIAGRDTYKHSRIERHIMDNHANEAAEEVSDTASSPQDAVPADPKMIVKTLTLGLGNPRGASKSGSEFPELDDSQRKKVYESLREGSKTFAMICDVLIAQWYAKLVMGVPNEASQSYKPNYKPVVERLERSRQLSSDILNETNREVKAHFAGSHGKELMGKGTRQLSTHRTDGTHPIPVRAKGARVVEYEGRILLVIHLFSQEYADEEGIPAWIAFPLKLKPRDKSMLGQLKRIVSGEWGLKNARIKLNTRSQGPKWLGQVVVGYVPEPYKLLDRATTLGIDLGVNAPATVHVRTSEGPNAWAQAVGDGRSMLNTRNLIRHEIVRILRALKRKPILLQGGARAAAQERLRQLRRREQRVLKTASRRIAAQIAEIARRNGAGNWQMEDLCKGIKEDNPWLARNWAPGAVVDAVRWQATQCGAQLTLVNPAYTSQRCSKCFHIARENRPKGKSGAAEFKCVKCGHSENADKNAARNISTPNIADLISSARAVES
jgi:putative transposase